MVPEIIQLPIKIPIEKKMSITGKPCAIYITTAS
jgi:hypothetical protein